MATSSVKPKIVIIDVPTEAGTHWPGQAKAPEALKDVGLVLKLRNSGYDVSNFSALDEVQHWLPTDIVNGVRDEENTVKVMRKVADAVSSAEASQGLLLVLGGDCSIEPGVLAGLNTVHQNDRIGLLYFDGDADLTLPATAGTAGLTGILDSMVISHLLQRQGGLESMRSFSKPDGSPLVDNKNIVLFGLDPSEPSADHWAFLAEGGFKVFSRPTVSRRPQDTATEALTWLESNVDKIVIHFDLDVIDSGKYPIGNYPHYAGLQFEEAMTALQVFARSEKLLGLVVTEVNPNNDPSGKMLEMLVDGIIRLQHLIGMDSSVLLEQQYKLPPVPSSPRPNVAFCRATPKDVPAIRCLLYALARYENNETVMVATNSMLLGTLSLGQDAAMSSQDLASVIMVFEDDVPVSLCVYFTTYSSWRGTGGIWIEDLFVREECRGRGHGVKLMAECAKELREKYPAGGRLEWSVKVWNKPTIAFYKSQGAITLDNELKMRLQDVPLEELAATGRGLKSK